jgi:integrase/recombinase XerD
VRRAGVTPYDTAELFGRLLHESVKTCPNECGSAANRGYLCLYHQGFEDGIDAVLSGLDESGEQGHHAERPCRASASGSLRNVRKEVVTEFVPAKPGDINIDRDELVASGFLVAYPEQTRVGYQQALKAWFSWCEYCGIRPLEAERAHIELWMRELLEKGNRFARRPKPLMGSTVNGMLNAVVGYYKFAHREHYITDDVTQYLKRPTVPNESRREGLTRFELRQCLEAAKASSPLDYALWSLLAFNGLRIGEACAIDVTDLGHHEGYRTLKVHREKGNRSGPIPIAPVTSNAIDHYLGTRTTGPLFLKPRLPERLDQKSANRIIKRISREAGIEKNVTPHSLRHTHVTLALNEGVSIRDLTNSMGYSDARQIARYDRDKSALARSATWAVAGALEGF